MPRRYKIDSLRFVVLSVTAMASAGCLSVGFVSQIKTFSTTYYQSPPLTINIIKCLMC